jgi:hypothetical protein
VGLIPGGATDEKLAKKTATDFDTKWIPPWAKNAYVGPNAPTGTPTVGDVWYDTDDVNQLVLPLSVVNGGTGGTTPADARSSLSTPSQAALDALPRGRVAQTLLAGGAAVTQDTYTTSGPAKPVYNLTYVADAARRYKVNVNMTAVITLPVTGPTARWIIFVLVDGIKFARVFDWTAAGAPIYFQVFNTTSYEGFWEPTSGSHTFSLDVLEVSGDSDLFIRYGGPDPDLLYRIAISDDGAR